MSSVVILSNEFGQVSKQTIDHGIEVLDVAHNMAAASVALYGGQVLSWQPKGHKEVFWLSRQAEFQEGKAIRGGIPICWPWFGPNVDNAGQNGGNHGFARNSYWQLIEVDIQPDEVILVLELAGENQHSMWPAAYQLRQELRFGGEFRQALTIHNSSNEEFQFSSALHSYFAISSPEQVQVADLNGRVFDDKITDKMAQTDHLSNCVGPIDRIYHHDEQQHIIDLEWQRKIVVRADNCRQWVLWNPGADIAQGMKDIHQLGEQEFVCLEAANTQWQRVPAGQSVVIKQRVQLESL